MKARTFGVILVALAYATNIAIAAPPPGSADAEADARRIEGMAAFKRQDYDAARIAFLQSYTLVPRTATLLSLALAELNSGHPVEAVRHLRQYVRASDAPADKVEEVRRNLLPRAESQVGRVQIDAPPGARVVVDGGDVGTAPLEPIDVLPGDHEVLIQHRDRTFKISVRVAAGGTARARAEIVDAAPTLPAPSPTPAVEAPPPSRPPERVNDAPPSWSTSKTIVVLSAGAASIVSAGLGVYFGIQSQNAKDDSYGLQAQLTSLSACLSPPPERQPLCNRLADTNQTWARDRDLAIGFYVGAGVLAVGALAAWLFWPSKADGATRAQIVPVFGGRDGASGLQVVGAF